MTDDDKEALARIAQLRDAYLYAVWEAKPDGAKSNECITALASVLTRMIAAAAVANDVDLSDGIAIAKRGIDTMAGDAYDAMRQRRH